MSHSESILSRITATTVLVLFVLGSVSAVAAQERPDRRKTQTNIPSGQLVSFQKDVPFNQFLKLINPVFKRVAGKPVVDPEGRSKPIGVSISGMHFLDAFEDVLEANNLTYSERPSAYVVQSPETSGAEKKRSAATPAENPADAAEEALASLDTREIRIDAILFNLNLTKLRNRGLKWDEVFDPAGQSGTADFLIETGSLFDSVDDVLQAPSEVTVGRLRRFLNLLEQDDVGQTISNPEVTVQSGQKGKIQVGQDVPIQTTDFSGNTVTQFFETGIIIDVKPTLITEKVADTTGAPKVDFVHLEVKVEDSNSQPSASGPVINRNQASTQVLLLDGESTAIGGLITTQETTSRSGVAGLKDLPGWLFGLRYIFGSKETNIQKQELLIVLRAQVVDPLRARVEEEAEGNLIDQRRRRAQEALERMGEKVDEGNSFPNPDSKPPENRE